MARLLIMYASVEGQTRKIAEVIRDWAEQARHSAVLLEAGTATPLLLEEGEYDVAFICGSVHQGRHPRELGDAVRESADSLSRIPTALLSVSLSAAHHDPASKAEANRYIEEFVTETAWRPTAHLTVAGALRYTKYDFLKRFMMRILAENRGDEVDVSRDWEYTDWGELNIFIDRFLLRECGSGMGLYPGGPLPLRD